MSCQCAAEAIECMPRPGVADLCCTNSGGCCKPKISLSDFTPEQLEEFDNGDELTGEVPEGAEAFLQQYGNAIDIAVETLANRSCMAKYAAGCCIKTSVCVPARCTCCCRSCDQCLRETEPIYKISRCVHHSRIESVTVNGEPASLNGDNPAATFDVSWCNNAWRLHGIDPDCGGRAELCFKLKPPTAAWMAAVASFACARVPCQHGESCDKEADRQYEIALRDRNLTGDDFADDLITECHKEDKVRLGRPSREEYVRWETCPQPEPTS